MKRDQAIDQPRAADASARTMPVLARLISRLAESSSGNLDTASPARLDEVAGAVLLRIDAAWNAVCEIEAIARVLRRESAGDDADGLDLILPAMLQRIVDLNSVVLSVLGSDNLRSTLELFEVVCVDPVRAAEIVADQGAPSCATA